MKNYDLLELLNYIKPSKLDYQDWVNVGMALKDAGYSASDWEEWSRKDPKRYYQGECLKKWGSFHGSPNPVTTGTIVALAKDHGWTPAKQEAGYALEWNAVIGSRDDLVLIKETGWVEGKDVIEPSDSNWEPVKELIRYLEILFESTENVGYVTDSWEKDGKFFPAKGNWDRTAGELIQQLNNCNGDIGAVIGDYKPQVGAWIRFNPLDGQGVKNKNVTDFRYSLVESDDMELDQQNAIIRELELPVACLVYSGGKSLHAIVKIDAGNYEEYRKRVDYLYEVCRKNGLKIDSQNRNPSRLSRMPGVTRNGNKQFLVATNIGKESWKEWQEWIEAVTDDLPDPENMADAWDNLPDLAPPLIDGVLRQGHKMLLAGPSKAGKSYALIQLCCAIAEGRQWFGWDCAQGKVMYVNLELDRASCLHRFKDVYNSLGWDPKCLENIDIWNLRGKAVPMDKLAPKLIRRAQKKNYIAIIIDPIYKVITGDENSADQMAKFSNYFDLVCHELGAAVIYCHHHSKGLQGQKRSMDRASGSGVFARDPDALLDLIELELNEDLLKQEENKAVCAVCEDWLERHIEDWEDEVGQDDRCNERELVPACERLLGLKTYNEMLRDTEKARKRVQQRSAWRIDGTLREFPKFKPVNLWFSYPIHLVDDLGVLGDVEAEGETSPWKKNVSKKKKTPKERKKERKEALETAYEVQTINGKVTVNDVAEYMNVTEKTIRNYVKEHGGFEIEDGIMERKD